MKNYLNNEKNIRYYLSYIVRLYYYLNWEKIKFTHVKLHFSKLKII